MIGHGPESLTLQSNMMIRELYRKYSYWFLRAICLSYPLETTYWAGVGNQAVGDFRINRS